MMNVSLKCVRCDKKMIAIGQIKVVGDGSIAHNLIKESIGGIYRCPRCGQKVDLYVRER